MSLNRLLQDNEPDVFEFLGFVAWYLFLVVCCVVPTACAYRRRRMMQQNTLRRQQEQRSDAQIYFTNFRFSSALQREEANRKDIQDALQKTTMVSLIAVH